MLWMHRSCTAIIKDGPSSPPHPLWLVKHAAYLDGCIKKKNAKYNV